MIRSVNCVWCGQPLIFKGQTGWRHLVGGGLYRKSCPECGWSAALHPEPSWCPRCGGSSLSDDHIATPDHAAAVSSRERW